MQKLHPQTTQRNQVRTHKHTRTKQDAHMQAYANTNVKH